MLTFIGLTGHRAPPAAAAANLGPLPLTDRGWQAERARLESDEAMGGGRGPRIDDVRGDVEVSLEAGPRTTRPAATAVVSGVNSSHDGSSVHTSVEVGFGGVG
ncbi:MAG: hypothetical protein ACREP9_14055, partial [Candidatus Dormibacteraceae bacterium]